jgi:hypothetical protein
MNDVRIKIADIVFGVSSDGHKESFLLEDIYRGFISNGNPDVTACGHYYKAPDITLREKDKVFESDIYWDVYRIDGRPVFVLRVSGQGSDPFCISVFDPHFRNGDTYFLFRLPGEKSTTPLPNPLRFPLFHLLMISLLAQGHGVLIHACGIDDNGKGLLFPGSPSQGKTTIARLWQNDAVVLNDERIVLRKNNGRLWIYGTPWHGDHEKVSTGGVLLEKIFFLRQSKTNAIKRIEGKLAVQMLLTHCLFPYWDSKGMQFVLGFCDHVTGEVPCYDLGFLPDKNVVEFIRGTK